MAKVKCIMAMYPLHEDCWIPVANSDLKVDVNVDFWEATFSGTEEEFDEWVANNPYGWHVVQVESVQD